MTSQTTVNSVIAILAVLLATAAWSDLKRHRIPNSIVLTGLILGVAFNGLLPSGYGFIANFDRGAGGFLFSLEGAAIGLVCLLPFYWMRAMGAGDVKLMAMVGAFVGPADVLGAVVFTFLSGGVLALASVALGHRWTLLGQNMRYMLLGGFINASAGKAPALEVPAQSVGKLPYGIAIAVGTLAWGIWKAMT